MRAILLLLVCLFCLSTTYAKSIPSGSALEHFINKMSRQYNFNKEDLEKLFSKAKYNAKVIASIKKPMESLPWCTYKHNLTQPMRVIMGVHYWAKNKPVFAKAEKEYGVPPQVILAILGIESYYGTYKGQQQYSVFNALSTLSFAYPNKRAVYFRGQLAVYLLLCRKYGFDPLDLKGSYTGALGQPQFMPTSYRLFAVSFDDSEKPNLFTNDADVIVSIANYLKKHGWQKNWPVAVPAKVSGQKYTEILKDGIQPRKSIKALKDYGITPAKPIQNQHQLASLLEMKGNCGPKFWLVFNNFYTITRYNKNSQYALAVYLLSQKIKLAYSEKKQ